MKNIYLCCLLFSLSLEAVTQTEQYWENQPYLQISKGLGVHVDLAYSAYLIELHSSEMDSAIDYNVLESTFGLSYVYEHWLVGAYGKFLVDELQSNMYVVSTQAPLNNHANIDKSEFALYVNYRFLESQKDRWGINVIYRYANLNAFDSYDSFLTYDSYLNYTTQGLAFSLAYERELSKKSLFVANIGLLYSKASVKMSESVNGRFQDSFIDDSVNALGFKGSLGYNYAYSPKLSLHFRTDFWKQDFASLEVNSRVGDTLPSASLGEFSYSNYVGFAWRF